MYKRIRFIFRYLEAFFTKHYKSIFFGLFLSIITIWIFPKFITSLPPFRFTKRVALIGRYTISNLPETIQSKISIGLTVINSQGLPGPGLANSWDISSDGKKVTFHLNPESVWQDNTSIQSTDIQYQFQDAQINYPNNHDIEFLLLKDPYSPLPLILSKPVFKNSKIKKSNNFIGAGSYKIRSYYQNGSKLETITLSPINSDNNLPYLVYHFYSSPQQAIVAFKLGEVQQVLDLNELNDISQWPNTNIIETLQLNRYIALFFNTEDPYFSGSSGKNLRLALAYATKKPYTGIRATGPIGPNSWVYNPDVKKYDYDLAKSKELLKKVEKLPEKIVIKTLPAYINVAEKIKTDWELLGLSIEIESQSDMSSDFQISLAAQPIPLDPDQYIYWHSTQDPFNITRLKNPRIDKILEDGRTTWDQAKRKELYEDFQKYLVEEVPAIFLYHPISYSVERR